MSIRNLNRNNIRNTDYFPVKEITDKVYKNGEPWYKVWWKGYPKSQSTWEPLSNFLNYIPILEYERKLNKNKDDNNYQKNIYLPSINERRIYYDKSIGDGYESETYFPKYYQNSNSDEVPKHIMKRFNIQKKILKPKKRSFMNYISHDLYGISLVLFLVCSYFVFTNFIQNSKSEETFFCPNTKCEIFKLYPYDKHTCLIEKNTTKEFLKEKDKYKNEVPVKEYTYEDMLIL